jgi:CheY-like chemotaxis protein
VPSVAANGQIALEVLRTQPCPHVILLDLLMPVMDGWQFRRQLLAHPTWAQIPVVVVSGAHDAQSAMIGLWIIRKPFALDQLLATLRAYPGEESYRARQWIILKNDRPVADEHAATQAFNTTAIAWA